MGTIGCYLTMYGTRLITQDDDKFAMLTAVSSHGCRHPLSFAIRGISFFFVVAERADLPCQHRSRKRGDGRGRRCHRPRARAGAGRRNFAPFRSNFLRSTAKCPCHVSSAERTDGRTERRAADLPATQSSKSFSEAMLWFGYPASGPFEYDVRSGRWYH